jgi:hypothetical protein
MASSQPRELALLFEYEPASQRWSWSQGLRDLYGLGPHEVPTTRLILDRIVEPERQSVGSQFEDHLATPGSFSCTFQMCDGRGCLRQVRYVGQSEEGGGEVKRVYGFIVDVTDVWRDYAAKAVAGAVEHRAVIEQAKGALMLSFGIDDATAFELLRGYSSRANVKLAVVAERIASGLSDPQFCRDEPVRSLLDIVLALESPHPR